MHQSIIFYVFSAVQKDAIQRFQAVWLRCPKVFERPLCGKFVKGFGLAQRRRERRVSQRKGEAGREGESTLGAEAAELPRVVCEVLRWLHAPKAPPLPLPVREGERLRVGDQRSGMLLRMNTRK